MRGVRGTPGTFPSVFRVFYTRLRIIITGSVRATLEIRAAGARKNAPRENKYAVSRGSARDTRCAPHRFRHPGRFSLKQYYYTRL